MERVRDVLLRRRGIDIDEFEHMGAFEANDVAMIVECKNDGSTLLITNAWTDGAHIYCGDCKQD